MNDKRKVHTSSDTPTALKGKDFVPAGGWLRELKLENAVLQTRLHVTARISTKKAALKAPKWFNCCRQKQQRHCPCQQKPWRAVVLSQSLRRLKGAKLGNRQSAPRHCLFGCLKPWIESYSGSSGKAAVARAAIAIIFLFAQN